MKGKIVAVKTLALGNYYGQVELVATSTGNKFYYYLCLDNHSGTNHVKIKLETYHALLKDTDCHA